MSGPKDMAAQIDSRYHAAIWLAREAGERTLTRFQTQRLGTESKNDGTPVTLADRDAEKFLRERIAEEYPDDGILGEEFGEKPGTSGIRWILDPIDGTKAYICGVPLYGTLIAVEVNGLATIGVIELPALSERVYACLGQGAHWQQGDKTPQPAKVSETSSLDEAVFCYTDDGLFKKHGREHLLAQLKSKSKLCRGWNDCYAYALLATGRCDVVADPVMELWDIAPLAPIVREAGGKLTDFSGQNELSRECLASNGKLHDAALACAQHP